MTARVLPLSTLVRTGSIDDLQRELCHHALSAEAWLTVSSLAMQACDSERLRACQTMLQVFIDKRICLLYPLPDKERAIMLDSTLEGWGLLAAVLEDVLQEIPKDQGRPVLIATCLSDLFAWVKTIMESMQHALDQCDDAEPVAVH